jgi:hypothetical protein
MQEVLLVTNIAALSKRIAKGSISARLGGKSNVAELDDDDSTTVTHQPSGPTRRAAFRQYHSGRSDMILDQLEEWDEPESQNGHINRVRSSNKNTRNELTSHRQGLFSSLVLITARYHDCSFASLPSCPGIHRRRVPLFRGFWPCQNSVSLCPVFADGIPADSRRR